MQCSEEASSGKISENTCVGTTSLFTYLFIYFFIYFLPALGISSMGDTFIQNVF